MIQRYQEEQWAKYDAQQKALSDARAALAAEVAQVLFPPPVPFYLSL